jgi:hypothetical protein
MKKLYNTLLQLTALAAVCLIAAPLKAQYAVVPDAAFVQYLQTNGFAGAMADSLLDTTSVLVLNSKSINCYSRGITDLTGIQYFKGLDSLDCSSNAIAALPDLPPALTYFNCQVNNLGSLPPLPATLTTLIAGNNNLLAVTALPPQLQYADCSINGLTALPALPQTLTYLNCSQNYIGGSLPALPPGLQTLICGYNSLSNLPALPATLAYLDCGDNPIHTLPALPVGLQYLYSGGNPVYQLPAVLPPGLLELSIINDSVSQVPPLPATLTSFACSYNPITTLPVLPPSLTWFTCSHTWLTSLPALGDSMWVVDCSNNPYLSCLPSFKIINQLNFRNTGITCLPGYGTVTTSAPQLDSVPLCGVFNSGSCNPYWNISGIAYYDNNTNCLYDSTDTGTGFVKMQLYSGSTLLQQVFTGGAGYYSFVAPGYGNYTIVPDTGTLPFTVACPATGYATAALSAADSLAYSNNFGFKCRTQGFDVGVNSICNSLWVPRPGALVGLNITAGDISQLYGAHCAAGIGGTVRLTISGPASYTAVAAGALTPVSTSINSVTWYVPDFGAINGSKAFNTLVTINPAASPGSEICITVQLASAAGDITPDNNIRTYCFTVVDAMDPNEKDVYPAGTIDTSQHWLTYTIHFQNTGNAPALNILVADTLSAALNPASFKLLASSHKNLTQLFGNVVKFSFPNINLPDSATSDSASRGYIQYTTKRFDSTPQGTIINNRASIYFDLNAPVVTNTTTNQLCTATVADTFATIACGDSVLFQGKVYYGNGVYPDTLQNMNGCDSIITLHLSVIADTVNRQTVICLGDSIWFYGNRISQPGNYQGIATGPYCDTVVKLTLMTRPLPVVTLCWDSMVMQGDLFPIYDNDTAVMYYACTPFARLLRGGHPAGGVYTGKDVANDSLFSPPLAYPTYGVDTFTYTYTDTNGCVNRAYDTITLLYCEGIQETANYNLLSVYPNPANNLLFIKTEGMQPQSMCLYEAGGKKLTETPFAPQIDISTLSAGVYFIEVKAGTTIARKRFVKM